MSMAAVDIDLGEHRKRHVVFAFAELSDLFGVARFLPAELVAGETKHREAARRKFALQLLQPLVLRREPAGACSVDDQEYLTFKPLQRNLFTRQRLRCKIINAWHYDLVQFSPRDRSRPTASRRLRSPRRQQGIDPRGNGRKPVARRRARVRPVRSRPLAREAP